MIAAFSLWSCTTAGTDVQSGLPNVDTTANLTETASATAQVEAVAAAETGAAPLPGDRPDQQATLQPTEAPVAASGDVPPSMESASDEAAAPAAKPQTAAAAEASATPATANQEATEAAENAGDGSVLTAAPEQPTPPKKTGLFAFFGSNSKNKVATVSKRDGGGAPAAATPARRNPLTTTGQVASSGLSGPAPQFNMAALDLPGSDAGQEPKRRQNSDDGGLPGVRQNALFEIKRRSGLDDDSDVDIYEDAPQVQLASAAGMARAPNGLLTQHEDVDVGCLKPALVRLLKQMEARYGRKLVVTSGYRSPAHNRRARGAKNSQHMYCAAADVQMPGVSKWELAKYARAMPGRGGVGTYCHTESIHVDIGPNRDWNWRCRGRRKK